MLFRSVCSTYTSSNHLRLMAVSVHTPAMAKQLEIQSEPCQADGELTTTVVTDEHAVPRAHCKDASASDDTDRRTIEVPRDIGSDSSTEFDSEDSEPEQMSSSEVEISEGRTTACCNSPFSIEETLMIFDWDDTLLPSTWVMKQGLSLVEGSVVSKGQAAKLAKVAEAARATLLSAKQIGRASCRERV